MAHRFRAASAIAALGCAAGDLVLPDTRAPAALAIESGDDQSGTAGTALPEPLVVRVTDAAQRSVEGATVEFSPTGDAAIVPASAVTGADGRARAPAGRSAAIRAPRPPPPGCWTTESRSVSA
ncbi:MAG TPA: Ig-like domain-containing protein [Gemmatimonadales bacterium]|nr:Ig-like domain-containing protein [Gemmatimonadales bacterium]